MAKKKKSQVFSDYFQLKKANIQRPIQKHIPIYVGANGTMMCELCGEMGDGWIPAYMAPEVYAERRKFVENGIKKSEAPGEKLESFDFTLLVLLYIGSLLCKKR